MKTAGELLQEKRLALELTLETVAQKTKIKPEYLAALETSDFTRLPSATFAKGFLRTYARALHMNADTILAMFRRDFEAKESGEIIPRGLVEPVVKKTHTLSVTGILVTLATLAFASFLAIQLWSWRSLPHLKVLEPQNGETYGEKLTVKGVTEKDAVITVNNQKVIVNPNGEFSLDLLFPAGTHSVMVTATNREGKTTLLERSFTVSK